MNVKQWALVFIFLLSADYVRVTAQSTNLVPSGQIVVRCRPRLYSVFDACLDRIRDRSPDQVGLPDRRVDNYNMRSGSASGFGNMQRTRDYICTCTRSVITVFVEISYLRILVSYTLSLVEGLLGGLLGNLGTALTNLLGNVVNLVVNILCLDIRVQIVVIQRRIPGTKCTVADFRVRRLVSINILGLRLSGGLIDLLSDLLSGLLGDVLRLIINLQMRPLFIEEFSKVIITEDMVSC